MRKSSRQKSERELLEEIKALLIVTASKLGVKSEDMSKALGIDGSVIRHILAGTKYKKKNARKTDKK